jgi:hypothetical protein
MITGSPVHSTYSVRGFLRSLATTLPAASAAACAPEVVRHPEPLMPATDERSVTIELLKDVTVRVGSGYRRLLPAGSVWAKTGRVSEGDVYKPVDRVFTVEGRHVHEAYLILDGERLVGFYLPVEHAYSPVPDGEDTSLSIRRR